jgi:hypothetical protein
MHAERRSDWKETGDRIRTRDGLAVLVSAVATIGLINASGGFDDYRQQARNAATVGALQDDLFEARLAIRRYLQAIRRGGARRADSQGGPNAEQAQGQVSVGGNAKWSKQLAEQLIPLDDDEALRDF